MRKFTLILLLCFAFVPTKIMADTTIPTVTPIPTGINGSQQSYINCQTHGGTMETRDNSVVCINMSQSQTQTASGGNVVLSTNNPQPSIPIESSIETVVASCPQGSTPRVQGSVIKCIDNNNVVIAANTSPSTQQTSDPETRELPRTGLPLAAWAITGLIPIGIKLKSLSKSDQPREDINNPLYLWQKREYLR